MTSQDRIIAFRYDPPFDERLERLRLDTSTDVPATNLIGDAVIGLYYAARRVALVGHAIVVGALHRDRELEERINNPQASIEQ